MPTIAEIRQQRQSEKETVGKRQQADNPPVPVTKPRKKTTDKKSPARKTPARRAPKEAPASKASEPEVPKRKMTARERADAKRQAKAGTEAKPVEPAPKSDEQTKPAPKAKTQAEKAETKGVKTFGGMPVKPLHETVDLIKMLVYGNTGVGKTFLCGTVVDVPSMLPALYLDFEGGSKTIRKFAKNIEAVQVHDVYDKTSGRLKSYAWEVLEALHEDLAKYQATSGEGKYRTLIIDSGSEMYDVAMAYVLQTEFARAQDKGREKHPDAAEERDWGIARRKMRDLLKKFIDLQMHVLITALDYEKQDQRTRKVSVGPDFPGKLRREIPAKMDEVYYLSVRTEKEKGGEPKIVRCILSQPDGKYFAKTRASETMPLTLDAPTMAKIVELVIDKPQEAA